MQAEDCAKLARHPCGQSRRAQTRDVTRMDSAEHLLGRDVAARGKGPKAARHGVRREHIGAKIPGPYADVASRQGLPKQAVWLQRLEPVGVDVKARDLFRSACENRRHAYFPFDQGSGVEPVGQAPRHPWRLKNAKEEH